MCQALYSRRMLVKRWKFSPSNGEHSNLYTCFVGLGSVMSFLFAKEQLADFSVCQNMFPSERFSVVHSSCMPSSTRREEEPEANKSL